MLALSIKYLFRYTLGIHNIMHCEFKVSAPDENDEFGGTGMVYSLKRPSLLVSNFLSLPKLVKLPDIKKPRQRLECRSTKPNTNIVLTTNLLPAVIKKCASFVRTHMFSVVKWIQILDTLPEIAGSVSP